MDNDKSQLNSINKNDLLEMRNKYKLNDSSNYDWYKNAGLIYDVLNKKYHISEEVLLKIFVHHYLDTLQAVSFYFYNSMQQELEALQLL